MRSEILVLCVLLVLFVAGSVLAGGIQYGEGHLATRILDTECDPTEIKWPSTCHIHFMKSGDVRIEGEDITPCAEKLETAARLARAAQRVNRKGKQR